MDAQPEVLDEREQRVRDILGAYLEFADAGCLELITCAGTHGFSCTIRAHYAPSVLTIKLVWECLGVYYCKAAIYVSKNVRVFQLVDLRVHQTDSPVDGVYALLVRGNVEPTGVCTRVKRYP